MTISEYINHVTLELCGILPAMPPVEADKMIFVNDLEDIVQQKLVEAKTWYSGDADALANLYRVDAMIEFKTEPFYWKTKRNYFWSVAVTENDNKISHSGFAKDMVDTIVSICGTPLVGCEDPEDEKRLHEIIDENKFWSTYRKQQMPMTLVCGWGAYKIDWKQSLYGNLPVVSFYDGIRVRFHKNGPFVIGVTFFDWYTDGTYNRYLLAETRARTGKNGSYSVTYRAFKEAGGNLTPVEAIPNLAMPKNWKNMPCMFAVPCSFYADNLHDYEGRSVFEGKIDLLDDLDQALSQQSNTVRRITPIEVFDLDYCERDPRTKMPKLPKSFERKYVGVRGKVNSNGDKANSLPVLVTQPELNADAFTQTIENLERMIISGHLSPASMGIDVDKRNSGDSLYERNKETVFTRNHLTTEESAVLKDLFNQMLIGDEFLRTKKVTKKDYGVTVEFDEFSDVAFESKLDKLSGAYVNGAMSPERYVDKLYGKSLSDEDRTAEIEFLQKKKEEKEQLAQGQDMEGVDPAVLGDVSDDADRNI